MALPLIGAGAIVLAWWALSSEVEDKLTAKGSSDGKAIDVDLLAIGNGFSLRRDAAEAFIAMREAAAKVGIALPVSSAFRTPEEQVALRAKLGAYGQGGLAAPVGFSPHQEGTAIDLHGLDPTNTNFDSERSAWLSNFAISFGWKRTGLNYSTVEPWHLDFCGVCDNGNV